MEVEYHPAAKVEVEAAAAWYVASDAPEAATGLLEKDTFLAEGSDDSISGEVSGKMPPEFPERTPEEDGELGPSRRT